MADTSMFSEMGSRVVSEITGGILWGGIAILAASIVGFLMWWFLIYKKKFDIKVKVVSQRAGDRNKIIFDKAAILKDRKTGTTYFRIWGLRLDLPSPKFSILQTSNTGDYLELYRTSEDDIYFLTPSQIVRTHLIKADGKLYKMADQKNKMVDPDIAYWAVQRKKDNKKMFDTEHVLMKILPYIPHIMGGVIMIFVLYVLFDSLPSILSQLTELTKELRAYRSSGTSTTVIAGLFQSLI